jgi:hypothetical protein
VCEREREREREILQLPKSSKFKGMFLEIWEFLDREGDSRLFIIPSYKEMLPLILLKDIGIPSNFSSFLKLGGI